MRNHSAVDVGYLFLALLVSPLGAQQAISGDGFAHAIKLVTVQDNVRVEVLDWGGSGLSVVLLAGYGDTAHVFDTFAPKLANMCHVYGITRRGFGASDAPASGYTVDRFASDVVAVLDALQLDRPILAGHSVAGDELTAIAGRYSDRIGGLVYLDAAYDRSNVKNLSAERRLAMSETNRKPAIWLEMKESTPRPDYQHVRAPTLAIFVLTAPTEVIESRRGEPDKKIEDPVKVAEAQTRYAERQEAIVKDFQSSMPTAHVVILRGANHYIFRSNEADVLREIRAFLAGLK